MASASAARLTLPHLLALIFYSSRLLSGGTERASTRLVRQARLKASASRCSPVVGGSDAGPSRSSITARGSSTPLGITRGNVLRSLVVAVSAANRFGSGGTPATTAGLFPLCAYPDIRSAFP